MINALHNAKNPYQGSSKKVLCVCSAGLLRSPTTAVVLERKYGYNTRACGIDLDHALIPLTPVLLYWADEIVVMEPRQKHEVERQLARFRRKNPYIGENKVKVYNLNVPDMYERMNEELQGIIHKSYAEVILEEQEEV